MTHPDTAKLAKDARDALGLSQDAFADAIGASKRSVANWEGGLKPPLGPARILLVGIRAKRITLKMLRDFAGDGKD
jgi:DNA-binding transcriptional regulator YiaG